MSQNRGHVPRILILHAALAVAPLFLASGPAFAASRSVQERAARKACLNGDYAKGVSILSDLYIDSKDHTYIFNQGRCLEQNRRYADAAAKFEEYLTVAEGKLSAEDKTAAEKHLAFCKEKLAEERGSRCSARRGMQSADIAPGIRSASAGRRRAIGRWCS